MPWDLLPGAEHWGWVEQKRAGLNGYRREWRTGSLRFFCEGPVEGMGVMLLLAGDGCRELEARMAPSERPNGERQSSIAKVGSALGYWSGSFDWQGWFAYLLAMGAHATRLDVALDRHDDLVTVEKIGQKVCEGALTAEAKSEPENHGHGGRIETWVFGKASSDSQVVIYDKAAEQGVTGPWTRVELREKHSRAQAMMALLVAGGVKAALGVLRRQLCFREVGADSNKSRLPVASWWAEFLEDAASLSLSVAPAMKALEDVHAWMEKAIAPTLAMLFRWRGPQLLAELVESGQPRLRPKHLAMLAGVG